MSFPRYPKYKDSGVEWLGEVPEHWGITLTKRFLTVQSGEMIASTDESEQGYPLIGGNGLRAFTTKWNTPGDTLVVGRVGALCGCVHHITEDFWASEHAFRVIEKQPFAKRFFYYLLTSLALNKFAIKTAQPLLNTTIVETQWIAVPPIPEQAAIAAFLDRETAKIDSLVGEQRRLIELLKEKRQAVISHAVTKGLNPHAPLKPSGIEWLGDVSAHWEVKPLKYSITKIEQGWSPQCESEPAAENEWGVLKVGCGNRDKFDPTEQKALPSDVAPLPNYEIKTGDILVSRGNTLELVGMATYVGEVRPRLLLCDLLYRFHAKRERAEGEFLVHSLRSPNVRFQIERDATGTSASMKKIGQGTIREFVIALPPLDEQRAIVTFIKTETVMLDTLTAEAQRAIDLLQERRTALISAAVTGKIDVRDRDDRRLMKG